MTDLDYLIEALEASISKHGEKPLTNKWLLNIVRLANNNQDNPDEDWIPF